LEYFTISLTTKAVGKLEKISTGIWLVRRKFKVVALTTEVIFRRT